MTDSPTRRAKELFLDAVELDEAERDRLLDRLRDEEPELFERVRQLLAADEKGREGMPRLLDSIQETLRHEVRGGGRRAGATLGDYELQAEIASGASGVVFRARQVSLDRTVAVKVLRSGRLAGAREVERFRAEAEAVARLDDPQIVPIYEVGDSEAGPYFSMKWIEGGSLADGPRARHPREAAEILLQVARAVHHAHQRGILHRDLKPSNILLDSAGTPYVADFGIAKRIDEDANATGSGWIAGTPAYMAPEQTSTDGGELSVATDVWALGAVLYELLAGRPAFEAKSITDVLLTIRLREPAPLPPGLPRDLVTIVGKCLAKEPERRYPSANALAVDLERWLKHEPILARRTSTLERLRLWARRRPLVAGLCAAVGLLVVALAVGATWASVRLQDQLERITEAEAEARERLRTSLLAQARDRRRGRGDGRRARALELILQAEIRPGPDQRDEAIACMAVFDVALERDWALPPRGSSVSAFDEDLELFATSLEDGGVVVRGVEDGAERYRLPGFGPFAWQPIFTRDPRRLVVKYHGAVDGSDAAVVLWDLEARERLATLPVLAQELELYAEESRLLATTQAGLLYELDVETGELVREVEVEKTPYRSALDPAGERIAISRYPEMTITVSTWPGLEELYQLEPGTTTFDLLWTEDGNSLLYTSADQHIHLLDAETAEVRRVFTGHRADVVRGFLSPVAPLLATASWDGTSRLWDLMTGEELLVMEARVMSFGRDGRLGFQTNERVGIWRVDPDPIRRTLHGHTGKTPTRVDFSPDGRLLVSSGGGEVILWDPFTARRLRTLEIENLREAFFHPDGRLLTITPEVGVQAWRLPEDLAGAPLAPEETLLEGDFKTAFLTPDGRILSALAGRRIHVRWLDGSRPDVEIEGYRGVNWPKVDPTGRWLACGSWQSPDVKVRVWDLATGEPAVDLCPEAGSVRQFFSPDGKRLVTGSGATYRVFRVGSWEEERVFERPIDVGQGPMSADFGPENTIVIEDVESAVRLHDLETGELLARFEPPEVVASGPLAIGPSGRFLAVGSENNRIELWDLERIRERLGGMGLEGDE